MKSELLYGIHPVFEALIAGRRHVYEIYFDKEKASGRLARIESMAEAKGIFIKNIGPADFKALTGNDGHQGASALVSPYPQVTVQDILQSVQGEEGKHFVLMLDNIQDPRNMGAIIRTALCVGIQGVIVPKDRSAPPDACGFQSLGRST